jgi:hypothetical protein
MMQIHQGEHQVARHSEHVSYGREAHPATILSLGGIATPVESIFHLCWLFLCFFHPGL